MQGTGSSEKPGRISNFARGLAGAGFLLAIPAGILWSLSPLGVRLSEYGFKTPNVFWKLFPSVPFLMVLALVSIYVFRVGERSIPQTLGFIVAVGGGLLVILGDIGLYHLRLDDIYIMTAPSWFAFRAGLMLLTAGTLVFAFGAARSRSLPVWGALPLAVASLSGLISVLSDYGQTGAAMWIGFGVGWTWFGLALAVQSLTRRFGKKQEEEPNIATADPDLSTAKKG